MRRLKVSFETDGGPWVNHDMPCPIMWDTQKAVFDLNQNVFVPSWKAQEDGWVTVRATGFRGFLIRWLARHHEIKPASKPARDLREERA